MGTQSSLPERPIGNSSRSPSPLTDPAVYGDGFDGLPRVPSTMPDFAATYGDMPDGLPRFSTQPKPEKKKKKKKKRTSRVRSSSQPVEEQQAPHLELQGDAIAREDERVANTREGNSDIAQEGVNGYVLEADALEDHQTKVEPVSWLPAPEPPSSKKKKRSRKSKATSAADEPDQLLSPDITASSHDLGYELGGAEAEGAVEPAISSPTEPTSAHKKRKRVKKVKTTTKEVALDLEEDPIAGSEEEDAAPSSPPRKRRSTDDNEASSSRKKPRRGQISSPIDDPVEDFDPSQNTIQPVHRAHRDTSRNTQGEISAMGQAFSKWKAREATRRRELAQDERGGDPQDPGNPVHEDGGHGKSEPPSLTSPRLASQRLKVVLTQHGADFSDGYAPVIGTETSPDVEINGVRTGPGDGGVEQDAPNSDAELDHDAMDMDEAPPGSDEDLGMQDGNEDMNEDGDDESMQPSEDGREEGSTSHASPNQITPAPAEQASDEDHIILSASSDEEERDEPSLPSAGETSSRLNGSEVITANGDLKASQRTPNLTPNGPKSTKLSPQRDNLDESADNDVNEPSSDDEQADPPAGGAGSETSELVGSEPENGAGHESRDEDVEMDDVASEGSTKAARPSTPNGHHAEPALATPGSKKSRALPTPGSKKTRSYSRLRPKPSFFEREAEDNARAFAELPSNETAPPPPKKTRAKRRLPIDVPDDSRPSSSAPGTAKKRKTTANGRRSSYIAARDDEQPTFNESGFRQGPLTQSEIAQVTRALDEFREEYQMAQYDLNVIIHDNPKGGPSTHRELWQRVQNACPTRKRGKLMSWCRLQFHNFVARGTWTEEQDEELRQMVKRHGRKWAEIGKYINRHQDDVRDRWRNYLVCSDKQNIRHWGDDELTGFVAIISEGLRLAQRMREAEPDNDELRALSNEQLIDWALVSEKMGFSRNRLQCQEKWKRMRDGGKLSDDITALLSPGSSSRAHQGRKKLEEIPVKDRYRLVRQVLRSGAKKDARIPWDTLVQQFGGRFKRQTLVMAWDRLKETVPDAEVSTTLDCAQHLVDAFEADGISGADTEDDEASDAQEPAKVKGWTPVSTRKGRGKAAAAAAAAATQRSSEMAVDPDSDVVPESDPEEDPSSGGDSSRATGNKTSTSHRPVSPGAQTPEEEDYDYVPGSKSSGVERGRGARDGSVDLSMDVDMDKDQDQDEPTPTRKAIKGKMKDKGRRKSSKNHTDALSSSPRESRKRPRADRSPEQTRSARAKKKAKRNGLLLSALESENGYDGGNKSGRRNGIASELSSNMSDMDDIPARVHLADEDRDE